MKTAILILAVIHSLTPVVAHSHERVLPPEPTEPQASTTAPQCMAIGAIKLTITCSYSAESSAGTDRRTAPRIILDRAVISFIPSNESHMSIELTFTNDSGSEIADHRMVYLAIEDERGDNHMRRRLSHVDFTKLEPGRLATFQEALSAPAFSPGPYIVSIWIPSTEPLLKFDPAHNFLLSSNGVPDFSTGLNQIAKFTVTASSKHKSVVNPN
jgi:hypothetical protein